MDEARGQDALDPGVQSDAGTSRTSELTEPEAVPATAAMRILSDGHPAPPAQSDGHRAPPAQSDGHRAPTAQSDGHRAPTVQVPAALLKRVIATIAEVRAEVRALHAQAVGAAEAAQDAQHEEACLVVLNMALNGAPQSEAEQYLSRHFPDEDSTGVAAEIFQRMARLLHG